MFEIDEWMKRVDQVETRNAQRSQFGRNEILAFDWHQLKACMQMPSVTALVHARLPPPLAPKSNSHVLTRYKSM